MASLDKALKIGFVLSATDKMSRIIEEAIGKSTSKLTVFERKVNAVGKGMHTFGVWSMGAGAAIGSAMFGAAKMTVDAADVSYKNAQKAGVGYKEWQRLAYAAEMAGVSQQELIPTFKNLNKVMTAVKAGDAEAKNLFDYFDIKGTKLPEVLMEVVDCFHKLGNEETKLAYAQDFLSESGINLMPFLNMTRDEIAALGNELEMDIGLFSEEDAKAAAEFDKALKELLRQGQSLIYSFGKELIPVFKELFKDIADVLTPIKDWISQNKEATASIVKWGIGIAGFLFGLGVVSKAIGILTSAFAVCRIGYGLWLIKYGLFLAKLKIVKLWTTLVTAAQWKWNISLLANPITIVIAAIAALVIGIIWAWNKFEGFREVVLGCWEVIKGFGKLLKDFVIDRIKSIITGLGAMGRAISQLFKGQFSEAFESAKEGINELSGAATIQRTVTAFNEFSIKNAWETGKEKGRQSWAASQSKKAADGEELKTVTGTLDVTKGTVAPYERMGADSMFKGMELPKEWKNPENIPTGAIPQPVKEDSLYKQAILDITAPGTDNNNTNVHNLAQPVTVEYSPQVTLSGIPLKDMNAEFKQMLKKHSAEIEHIINDALSQRKRLAFAD